MSDFIKMKTGQLSVDLFNAKVKRYNCAKSQVNSPSSSDVMTILVFQCNMLHVRIAHFGPFAKVIAYYFKHASRKPFLDVVYIHMVAC